MRRTGRDLEAAGDPARPGSTPPGPRRVRAPGPGGSGGRSGQAARRLRGRARRRRHDRLPSRSPRALAGPRSPRAVRHAMVVVLTGYGVRMAQTVLERRAPRHTIAGTWLTDGDAGS